MTPGLEVLVQEVIEAITTEPWVSSHYSPLNWNLTESVVLLGLKPNPLKPT